MVRVGRLVQLRVTIVLMFIRWWLMIIVRLVRFGMGKARVSWSWLLLVLLSLVLIMVGGLFLVLMVRLIL